MPFDIDEYSFDKITIYDFEIQVQKNPQIRGSDYVSLNSTGNPDWKMLRSWKSSFWNPKIENF